MKTFIAAIFLFAFTSHTFSKAVIYVDFLANQKFIAANLCVNKSMPAMNCHGKCQLTKKIKSEENKDTQNANRKNENRSEVTCPETGSALIKCIDFACILQTYPSFSAQLQTRNLSGVFRPPTALDY